MNRTLPFVVAIGLTAADANAATVRLTGASPLRSRLLAEFVAVGFENCGRDCARADAAVVIDEAGSIVTFEGATTMRLPLRDGNDCVRFAEQVRAKLLPLLPELRRTEPLVVTGAVDIPSPRIVPKMNHSTSLRTPKIELALGPAIARQGGGLALDLSMRARWFPWERLGIGLSANAPLMPASLSGAEGDAHISAWLMGAEVAVRPLVFRFMHVGLGVGVYAVRLTVSGEGKAPYVSGSSSAWVAAPYGFVEAAPRFGSHWSVPLTTSIGFATPPTDIRFAGRAVDQWGSPMIRVSAGAQYAF